MIKSLDIGDDSGLRRHNQNNHKVLIEIEKESGELESRRDLKKL